MLRVASFTFEDAVGMNLLLDTYRLAAGAHIMVSEGRLVIPYEDGEPKNAVQRIIDIKEQKNTIIEQMEIISHSQNVLVKLREDAMFRLGTAEADFAEAKSQERSKKKYDDTKVCEARMDAARAAINDIDAQQAKNNMEIERLVLNITLFDERIKELEGAPKVGEVKDTK